MKSQQIHQDVAEVYADALSSRSGCCSGITQLAGYTSEDLKDLPQDSQNNSFGCGNPLAFTEVKEGDTVLDLGSGAGLDLIIARKKVGEKGRVIGVDMTDKMIAMARQNIESSGFKNIEIRKGLIEDLPVESNSVDWVISNCVVNLSPNKSKVFSEIHRVLKPSGKMLISDIVVNGWPKKVLKIGKLLPKKLRNSLHISCVSQAIGEQDYLRELAKAGFQNIEVRGRLVYEPCQMKTLVESDFLNKLKGWRGKIIEKGIRAVAGKIWSAKFFAEKI